MNSKYWVVGALAGGVLALASHGLAGDEEALHYLLARYAPAHPENWIGVAGRPLVTLALTLPAQVGLVGARLASAAATGAAAWAVARVAARAEVPAPIWAVLLFLAQPFLLAHAGTAMTEPWAAALLAWGMVAVTERRWRLLAALAALIPLARLELAAFWPMAAALLWRERRRAWIVFLPVFVLAWNAIGALSSGDALWLAHRARGPDYALQGPLHYVMSLAWVFGPGVLVPLLVGAADRLAREAHRGRSAIKERGAVRRAEATALVMAATLLALYTALAARGPGTGGNLRYLAMAAPAAAVLAASGLRALAAPRRPAVGVALAAGIVGALALWRHPYQRDLLPIASTDLFPFAAALLWAAAWALPSRPRRALPAVAVALALLGLARDHRGLVLRAPTGEERAVLDAGRWVRARGEEAGAHDAGARPPVYAAHPLLAVGLDDDPYDRARFPAFDALGRATPGSLLLWDSHYAPVRSRALADDGATDGAAAIAERGARLTPPIPDATWGFLAGFAAPDTSWAGAIYARGAAPDTAAAARWNPLYRSAFAGVAYARAATRADPRNPARWRELAQRLALAGRLDEARAAARTGKALREGRASGARP